MSWSWLLINALSAFLLPPLNGLLMLAAGWLLWRRKPNWARGLTGGGILLLWLMSTPYVADSALQWLEGAPVALDTRAHPAEAIVVLGGGTYFDAPEYGGDTLKMDALERVRYAAKLQRETGLPVLTTGGRMAADRRSEAEQMAAALEQEFNVPVRWQENDAENTWENAKFSAALLHAAGIRRIYLVSHAWHLPRALPLFRAAGLEVVPAPTVFTTRYRTDLLAFLPSARALHNSKIFVHEWIGVLWYRVKSAFAN